MYKELTLLVSAVLALGLAGAGSTYGAEPILQCDAGDGAVQAGWTRITMGNTNVGGITVALSHGPMPGGSSDSRVTGLGSGPLADVEDDFYFPDNTSGSPGADMTLTLSGMDAGDYMLHSYHNDPRGADDPRIVSVTVTGAADVTTPTDVFQNHDMMSNPLEILFTYSGSGNVVITYHAMPNGLVFFNGFTLEFASLGRASSPSPANGAQDVSLDEVLGWSPGEAAVSHNVYLGTDEAAVTGADEASDEFRGSVDVTSYDAGQLELGTTYYWRVDEVNDANSESPWTGNVWSFTTVDGKATDPGPSDGAWGVQLDTILTWTPDGLATSHDLYFGINEASVAAAGKDSCEYKGAMDANSFDPGSVYVLSEGATYYWRVDELGSTTYARGNVWSFSTTGAVGNLDLKIDIALPVWTGTENVPDMEGVPIPETLKDGWTHWASGRWGDMYGHGTTAVENVDGTGVSTMLSTVYGGLTAVKATGMCMPTLNGGTPYGSPVHDPICNTWMQVEDHPENPGGDIILALYNLPPGEYELYSYHNNFECHRAGGGDGGTPACCDQITNPQPLMPSIMAMSLSGLLEHYSAQNGWARWEDVKREFNECKPECLWDHPVCENLGDGVDMIEGDYNVQVQQVTSDDELVASHVQFRTNGSAVHIVYESGCCVSDGIRPGRTGGRAILNAFELKSLGPPPVDSDDDGIIDGEDNCPDVPNPDQADCNCNGLGDACDDAPCGPAGCVCPGDLNADDQIDLDDLQEVAGILLDAGSPFIMTVEEGHCADLNEDGQVDLDDLQAVAGILLDAGSPFIVTCE